MTRRSFTAGEHMKIVKEIKNRYICKVTACTRDCHILLSPRFPFSSQYTPRPAAARRTRGHCVKLDHQRTFGDHVPRRHGHKGSHRPEADLGSLWPPNQGRVDMDVDRGYSCVALISLSSSRRWMPVSVRAVSFCTFSGLWKRKKKGMYCLNPFLTTYYYYFFSYELIIYIMYKDDLNDYTLLPNSAR